MTGGGRGMYTSANFGRLVLGCIKAGFGTKYELSVFFEIQKISIPLLAFSKKRKKHSFARLERDLDLESSRARARDLGDL